MTITYSIRNITSSLIKTVMMRKFFQMVFVGNDNKSLHIYTATILGASDKIIDADKVDNVDNEKFISNFEEFPQFRLKFEISVGSNDNNGVVEILNEDVTNTEHGFLNEIDCIRKVWGEKCKIISDNQNELIEKLKVISASDEEGVTSELNILTAQLSQHKILWTEQAKNGRDDNFFKSLSIAGVCEVDDDLGETSPRDGIAMKRGYVITPPSDVKLPKGIELVNWVRTTIRFKYTFDDANLNYILKKEDDGPDANTLFLAPDYTWYFSPKIKSFIDNRNSMVELKRRPEKGYEICKCPLQSKERIFYQSDKYQNSVNTVPNKLTVNFHYWKDEEKINSRQKYRLAAKDILPRPDTFADVAEINIFLDMADEHNRGNRQFILGIFLSFALSFGIDSTRLGQVENFFAPLNYLLPADIWWITFLGMCALTLMTKPVKISEESRKINGKRRSLLVASAVWTVLVLGIFRSPYLFEIVKASKWICCATGISLFVLIVLHLTYLCSKKVNLNGSFWKDLIGEDIL